MTNDLIITSDGWDDAAAEANARVLRGTLLKFADWNWVCGKEANPIEKGTQLVAIGTASAWVRWANGKPADYRMKPSGKPLLDREQLGDTDQTLWEKGPDAKPRDPWQHTKFVYLVDQNSAQSYTFSTSSFGGHEAVRNLADAIARMRTAHPNAMAVVALDAAPMATRYGRKSKPILRIVGWKAVGAGVWGAPQLPSPDLEPAYEP
jgi:hypothetical protein